MPAPFQMRFAARALLLSAIIGSSGACADGVITTLGGVDFSRGKFGESTATNTWSVPLAVKYETDDYSVKAAISYLQINGPGNVVGGGGDYFINLGGTVPNRRVSGWGDLVLSGTWTTYASQDGTWLVDLGAKIKLGTADDTRGLGTGKTDYAGEVDLYKRLGPGTLFFTLGKRKMGDTAETNFVDPVYTSVGWSQKVANATSAGAMYDFRQPVVDGHAPARDATLFLVHKFTDRWKVQFYAGRGFSDASPDANVGVILFLAH